jgi:ribonuclease Z
MEENYFLIDCGEGTQVELRRQKIKFSRIDNIFISHLHGDHWFGLAGLISSFHLLSRTKDLHIYSPPGLKDAIISQLRLGQTHLSYFIHFHELEGKEPKVILENAKLIVKSVPLNHRIETYGFLFEEKKKLRKLNAPLLRERGVEVCDFRMLQLGNDVQSIDGKLIKNSEVTFDPPEPLKYAYCSDTAYYEPLVDWLAGVDVLYHESTFLEQNRDLATKTFHSTAKDAATIASKAKVNYLILGHFSSRYRNRDVYKEEAKRYFQNIEISEAGKIFSFENK